MTIVACPTCRRKFQSEQSDALPFCCHRCRTIDLGRWLKEEYGLPVDPEADEQSEPSPDDDA